MARPLNTWLSWLVCVAALSGCTAQPVYRSRSDSAKSRPAPQPAPQPAPRTQTADASSSRPASSPPSPPSENAHPVDPASVDTSGAYQIGVASYYGKQFHGRQTASGETFNMYRMTAAHRVLPLGTWVRVTRLDTGRWVDVKVNDRGPFVEGRVLDLSFAAALELEMVRSGTARVMIELLDGD